MKLLQSLLLPSLLIATSGCGDDTTGGGDNNLPSCDEDTRDEEYVAGIAKLGEADYTIALMDANPAPPSKGDNTWTIEVANPEGGKQAGLGIKMVGTMPDHGHGTLGTPAVSDDGDGAYTVGPVNLFMPGYWEVEVTAMDLGDSATAEDDVKLDAVVFKFCIEG